MDSMEREDVDKRFSRELSIVIEIDGHEEAYRRQLKDDTLTKK